VKYRERFFVCTALHFANHEGTAIAINTGMVKDKQLQLYILGDFSTISQITFEETPDAEDLEFSFSNPDKSGQKLDIAFREVPLLDNILQHERHFVWDEFGEMKIPKDGKTMPIIDGEYELDENQLCSFYGRIRPHYENGGLATADQLYWGLGIKNIGEHYFEMDLGEPIRDHQRFKGCSGAPIFDTRGKMIGIVTHGSSNVNDSAIYGYRIDRLKRWIDLLYFNEEIISLPYSL
jgi:hypothetical protein